MTTPRTQGFERCTRAACRLARVMPLVLAAVLLSGKLTAQTADLSITKTGPAQVDANGTGIITYLLTTTNNGPSTATNVIVRDTLPPTSDFSFISASRGASRSRCRRTAGTSGSGSCGASRTRCLRVCETDARRRMSTSSC